jgi:putative transposase
MQVLRAAGDQSFELTAYCFMPDHLHLLVEAQCQQSDCKDFIKRAKQYSGFHYKKQIGRPLWQRYSYERTLRVEDETLSVARYITRTR